MNRNKITVIKNISECITLADAVSRGGRHLRPEDLSIINEASIIHNDNEILWVGKQSEAPQSLLVSSEVVIDAAGSLIFPGLVDCHTHLVFAGDRSNEYKMRLNGASYEEIAKQGGGIVSTATATREADVSSLKQQSINRIMQIVARGVTAIEIKTGYGLNWESELKLSKVISELKLELKKKNIDIVHTFMAAHAIPKEFSNAHQYLNELVIPLLTHIQSDKNLRPDFVDIFIEENYFSHDDAKLLFQVCQKFNLPIKAHVDELKNSGSLKFAVEAGATSCEHMLYSDTSSIKSLAASSTIGVLLPGTAFFLGKQLAAARAMLDAGARLAIASDFNPGSCHWDDVWQIAKMSAPSLKMNVAELICAVTYNAAAAIGLNNQGAIVPKMKPKFTTFKNTNLTDLIYHW